MCVTVRVMSVCTHVWARAYVDREIDKYAVISFVQQQQEEYNNKNKK